MISVLSLLTCLLFAGIGRADEIDDLVRQLKEPARFKDHVPEFRVEETPIRVDTHLRKENGLEISRTWVVMDGDRCVAFYPEVVRPVFNSMISYLSLPQDVMATPMRLGTMRQSA